VKNEDVVRSSAVLPAPTEGPTMGRQGTDAPSLERRVLALQAPDRDVCGTG